MSTLTISLVLSFVLVSTAFLKVPLRMRTAQVALRVSLSPAPEKKTGFAAFLDNLISCFSQVLDPSGWESQSINVNRIVKNPSPYQRPRDAYHWRGSSLYHEQEVAERFAASFGVDIHSEAKKKQDILDELNSLSASLILPTSRGPPEGYAIGADGLRQALSPMQTELNPERVVSNPPRFSHGVKASHLKKVLRKDRDYFE